MEQFSSELYVDECVCWPSSRRQQLLKRSRGGGGWSQIVDRKLLAFFPRWPDAISPSTRCSVRKDKRVRLLIESNGAVRAGWLSLPFAPEPSPALLLLPISVVLTSSLRLPCLSIIANSYAPARTTPTHACIDLLTVLRCERTQCPWPSTLRLA